MSGFVPYFADDEDSSEDKVSSLEVVNITGTDQIRTSEAKDKSNDNSALTDSQNLNEDYVSFDSTSVNDSKVQGSQNKTSEKPHTDSKFCPKSSEVSCEDLVIVLEERKFLKVLEDVVKELVEKLVTEKLSNKGSANSKNQISHIKLGNKKVNVRKSFDTKIKEVADAQRSGLETQESGSEISESEQSEQINLESESSITQPSQQRNSKAASESTQGKSTQSKTKSSRSSASSAKSISTRHRGSAPTAKGTSEITDKGVAKSIPTQDHKEMVDEVCFFKSKSSKAKKTPRREREPFFRDNTCKTTCKRYMRLSPEDLREKNLRIANSLFSATLCLLMKKIKSQDLLADKIGIALCSPRQCFDECSTQKQFEALEAQTRSTTKPVLPKLKTSQSPNKSSGLISQESSTCTKHCREATLTAPVTPTVLPKL
ncbi:uncharacterized G-patch domain protein DDB_G0278987-like isoform X2 [Narcine bancroftii]|uniref:uncharacterized G-patch domain protein DDB_G0278987-like isoform X2 n=1 Tax=Narcine bancroftii TaxID=1343680 RepID=UPI00383117D8